MRKKRILIVLLISAVAIFLVYSLLFEDTTFIKDLIDAGTLYNTALNVDYDAQKVEHERLTSQIKVVDSELSSVNANLKNIEAEKAQKEIELRNEKINEVNSMADDLRDKISDIQDRINIEIQNKPKEDIYLSSTSDEIYQHILKGLEDTTTDVVAFVGENAEDGSYTVKFVGYIESLSDVLDNVVTALDDYNISVGHYSLRQIYACYNNMRPWDRATLLNWYDKTYITGSGNVGQLPGGYIVNGIKLSDLFYGDTIATLTAEKDADLAKNEEWLDAEIEKIESARVKSIIEAYKGIDQDKVDALVASLNQYYDGKIAEKRKEADNNAAEITKKFNKRLEAFKYTPPEVDLDGDGEIDPVEPDTSLADHDLLIYTLDITFSVYAK